MLYGHGDDSYKYGNIKAHFSSNICRRTDLSGLYRHLSARMDRLTAYPEPEPASLLQRIRRQRMPWSVNAPAIEAGSFFLQGKPLPPAFTDDLLKETGRLRNAIGNLKIADVWPTDTHFFPVRLRIGKAGLLKQYLAEEHRILIRDASNFEGLDDAFIRIATQTPDENNLLVKALKEWKTSFTS